MADNPERPMAFRRIGIVWPVFAHEPTVTRAPTGEYVMYFTTNYGQKSIPCTGKSCFGFNGTSDPGCPNDQQCHIDEPLLTRMSYSNSPYGPWSEPKLVPSPDNSDTNLACTIAKNGSVLCLGRPQIGMYRHDDWKNVSHYKRYLPDLSNIVPDRQMRGEDPMVWVDSNDVFHAILHGGGWDCPFGYHYFSLNGIVWYGNNNVKIYENIIETLHSKPINVSRRERPHVILGKDGRTPIGLSTAVTGHWPCTVVPEPVPGSNGTHILCPNDYCYTLIQTLKGFN